MSTKPAPSNAAETHIAQQNLLQPILRHGYSVDEDLEAETPKACEEGDDVASLRTLHSLSPKRLDKLALIAAEAGQTSALQSILFNGASVTKPDLLSAALGNPELLEILIDQGLDVNYGFSYTGSLLASAAWAGQVDAVRILLKRGADANTRGGRDRTTTALAAAAGGWNPSVRAVELLLDHGAKIEGSGALNGAVRMGKADIVTLLVTRRADVNDTAWIVNGKRGGGTPLRLAKRRGDEKIAHILVMAGGLEQLENED